MESVLFMLEKFFAPDIRVKLDDSSRIIGFELLTMEGTFAYLNSPQMIIGQDYDAVGHAKMHQSVGDNIIFGEVIELEYTSPVMGTPVMVGTCLACDFEVTELDIKPRTDEETK